MAMMMTCDKCGRNKDGNCRFHEYAANRAWIGEKHVFVQMLGKDWESAQLHLCDVCHRKLVNIMRIWWEEGL